jgi:hypothetical protein
LPSQRDGAERQAIVEKADRTAIHQLFRTTFGGQLLTETRQEGDDQLIDIMWAKGNAKSERTLALSDLL